MDKLFNGELPIGFGMELAKNFKAMNYFASLPQHTQETIVEGARNISSKDEMRQYVNMLSQD